VDDFTNPKIEYYIYIQAMAEDRIATIQQLEYQGYVYNYRTDIWEHPSVANVGEAA